MDAQHLISTRASAINGSGIRRVFDLAAKLKDPVNLSIGQPDFPVDQSIKDAATRAIQDNQNGYTPTAGIPALRQKLIEHVDRDLGWDASPQGHAGLLVTSGTSGALVLACMAMLNSGDEIIVPDPWFVLYPHMASLCGGRAVPCDTYPDFRLTAARVEKLITPRTKAVVVCSPGNPAGVVNSEQEMAELLELCRRRGVVLISDEIYEEFCFSKFRTQGRAKDASSRCCPSPARLRGAHEHVLVVRGFGKAYGVTGWRLGYAAGPAWLINEMIKLQQYLYVCAPTPLQHGVVGAVDVDLTPHLKEYERRRDLVVSTLSPHTELAEPGGAFYAFVKVPERLGYAPHEAGEKFFRACADKSVLVVPGRTFSSRDTHFRLSYATPMKSLERGLEVLAGVMSGRTT